MDENVANAWRQFLNPNVVRTRLLTASIYIAAFEALKDAIVTRLRDFFWAGFDESGNKIDPRYDSEVLSRKKDPVYASLDWLVEMQVIDGDDVAVFNAVKQRRNKLAHELLSTLGADGLPPDIPEQMSKMVTLLNKIEVWWIINVELATDENFTDCDVDQSGIVPGRVMTIQLLLEIALGDDEASRYYYDEFCKRREEDR